MTTRCTRLRRADPPLQDSSSYILSVRKLTLGAVYRTV
ncbi:hypothetical protein HSB1_03580 [Halogranum salarium B-1]|uniref:Uncharacterized protein n=1 Tax=Halogranum salarium B-1 TaxID=1210908 RepID=J3F020_9EURY|nr:hypothetical protein HSB1_03580 [Halogranum salarium B-1]